MAETLTSIKWVEKATEEKLIPPFNVRNGFWRPDFLLESETERFLICEINARFPFELLPLAMYGHQALSNIGTQQKLYGPATDPNKCTFICDILSLILMDCRFLTISVLHLTWGCQSIYSQAQSVLHHWTSFFYSLNSILEQPQK